MSEPWYCLAAPFPPPLRLPDEGVFLRAGLLLREEEPLEAADDDPRFAAALLEALLPPEDFLAVDFLAAFFGAGLLAALFLEPPFLAADLLAAGLLAPPFFAPDFLAPDFLAAGLLAALFLAPDFLEPPFLAAPLDLPEEEPPLDEELRRDDFFAAPFDEDLPPALFLADFFFAAFLVDFAIVNGI
jgi:hypothetical protein